MKNRHRTTRDSAGRLVVTLHADVVAAATDPELFSNATSARLQVPNGLDGTEHAAVRRSLDPFFSRGRIVALLPDLEQIAHAVVDSLATRDAPFDAVGELGARFAVRAQSTWLGWPESLDGELLAWVADNREATRAGGLERLTELARRFDDIVRHIVDERRTAPTGDVTSELMRVRIDGGRTFRDLELVSILRNWTGGDLSSLALCVGVVVAWLVQHPDGQSALTTASDRDLDAAIDEILRIDDPFVSNRRRATRDTVVSGCPVAAGEQIVLHWRAANRDTDAVGDPDTFDPSGNAAANLVWGIGPHACPGRPLAIAELRVLVRALLRRGAVVGAGEPVRERAPVAGYRSYPVRLVALT